MELSGPAFVGGTNPYRYTGKEWETDLDLGLYDFGARWYDPAAGRWWGVDALAEKRNGLSPFNYAQNNPILRIDPDGNLDNPIYNFYGTFLGTDNRGLQGEAIIMDEANFSQGMSHEDALDQGQLLSEARNQNYPGAMSDEITQKIDTHVSGLSSRPDWDGVVTIDEGIEWARAHPNLTAQSVTANDALYLDVAQMDFGSLGVADFQRVGVEQLINLLDFVDLTSDLSRFTTYALGRTRMTLVDNNGGVEVSNGGEFKVTGKDFNDYDWSYGGRLGRNLLIWGERNLKGLNDSHGFPLKVYGQGQLNN